VVLVGRSEERLAAAHDTVAARATGEAQVETVVIDLSSLESVRHGAGVILEFHPEIHALVNNAGVLLGSRQESADGFELTFATNVLGPFLLTELLLGALEAGAEASGQPSRIVSVSSGGMYTTGVDLSDLQSHRGGSWSGSTVYARTKRMQLMLTDVWARRLADRGITANAMHPGWADTPGVQDSLPAFHRLMGPVLRSPAEGADTITWLVADPGAGNSSGGFWHDRRRRTTSRLPGTSPAPGDDERLVVDLRRLSGLEQ
jgi:NAD(P)-dependent dehydrogenase (short-subunit alcohol dehydrogenase family)